MQSKIVRTLKKFDNLDLVVLLLEIDNKIKSRQELAEFFGFGEGSIKSMLKLLRENKLIFTDKKGNRVTEDGKEYLLKIYKTISPIAKINYDIFKDSLNCHGCVLKEYDEEKLCKLYVARERAIRIGCNSAMTLICEKNKLKAKYVEEFDFSFLREIFNIKEGELLILTSSDSEAIAKKGIISICCYLSKKFDHLLKARKLIS